jgi:hypothetical protein
MSKVWPWIAGITVTLCIVALLLGGRSNREDYWTARVIVVQHAPEITPTPIDRLMQRSPGQ